MPEGWRYPHDEEWDVDPDSPDQKFKEPKERKVPAKRFVRYAILGLFTFIISYYGTLLVVHHH